MAQKRLDRQKDFTNGVVKFVDLETGNDVSYTIDQVFGKGTWAALAGLSNGKMAQMAMVHSLNAFGGDAAADKSIDAIAAIKNRVESVIGGDWSARGTGEGGVRETVLALAIARVKNLDVGEVATKLAEYDDVTKKALKKNSAVKAAMADIQAERSKAKAKILAKEAKEAGEALSF